MRVNPVEHRQVLSVTLCHDVLPNGEDEQDGREDEVDYCIRNKYDTEKDDDERQQHQRRVNDGSVMHLLSLEADIQT